MEPLSSSVVVRPFFRGEWETYRSVRLLALQTDPQQFSSTWEREVAFDGNTWIERSARCVGMFTASAEDVEPDADSNVQPASTVTGSGQRPLACVGLAGVISSALLESSETDKHGRRMCEIVSVWLSPGLRGKGLGKQLMNGILDFAAKEYAVANISVKSSNLPALTLYRSVGFEDRDMSDVTLTGDVCACDVRLQRPLLPR